MLLSYINIILEQKHDDKLLNNTDIASARSKYSTYFKEELDDEIKAHWPEWEDAISALRDIGYPLLLRDRSLMRLTIASRSNEEPGSKMVSSALSKLFEYSVVSYLRPA